MAESDHDVFCRGDRSAADQPQWGQYRSRNMVSEETGLPESCDPATGKNIKWSVPIGTQSYATPVVAQGRVIIGTNNDEPRDPKHTEDGGVVLCLDEKDGHFCWQFVSPRLENDPYLDQPHIGLCSPATVENGRVYIVSNRAQVLCMSLLGHGEILWRFDMPSGVGSIRTTRHIVRSSLTATIFISTRAMASTIRIARSVRPTHQASSCSINRPDDSSPGTTKGSARTSFMPVGRPPRKAWSTADHLFSLAAATAPAMPWKHCEPGETGDQVVKLKRAWRFDGDPTAPKKDIHSYVTNRKESPSVISGMPVFYKNRIYVTLGGDIWWGKHEAWLQCIDAVGSGDISATNLVWSCPLSRHCCATPAIYAGMVFVGDCGHQFHCIDAETGKPYWTEDVKGEVWGSALVADGRVYLGTRAAIYGLSQHRRIRRSSPRSTWVIRSAELRLRPTARSTSRRSLGSTPCGLISRSKIRR